MKKFFLLTLAVIAGAMLCGATTLFESSATPFRRAVIDLTNDADHGPHVHDCVTAIDFHNESPHDVLVHVNDAQPVILPAHKEHRFHVQSGTHTLHVTHEHYNWTKHISIKACESLHIDFNHLAWEHHHQKE